MNKQMWNLYKESDRGKKCIEMFNPEIENTYNGIKAILDFSEKWENKIPVESHGFWRNQIRKRCGRKDSDTNVKTIGIP